MKVEVSLLAGLLVIATTLLVGAQIQGLEGALLSMAVEYSFRGMRAGSRILHNMSRWIWLSGERVTVVLKQVSYVDSAGKMLLAKIFRRTAQSRVHD
jgi:hypothetical protein